MRDRDTRPLRRLVLAAALWLPAMFFVWVYWSSVFALPATSLARTAGYSQREMYRVLAALYSRLGASTRTEALLRADRWGLLNTPTASTISGDDQTGHR